MNETTFLSHLGAATFALLMVVGAILLLQFLGVDVTAFLNFFAPQSD